MEQAAEGRNSFAFMVFVALAASGKSEALKFIRMMPPQKRLDLLHIGPEIVVLDDFPYVDLMRHIDDVLVEINEPPIFFPSLNKPFLEPQISWKLLIELLNQDCETILAVLNGLRVERKEQETDELDVSSSMLTRLDRAREKIGAKALFYNPDSEPFMGRKKMNDFLHRILGKARRLAEARDSLASADLDPSRTTILLEFARGGRFGSQMPLPYAYADSFSALHPRVLQEGVFLYLKVLPEQAIIKNFLRANPSDPGSILGHCVPLEVMYNDYGCDDFPYLLSPTGEAYGFIEVWTTLVPGAILDNTKDLTTFVREHKNKGWGELPTQNREALLNALRDACDCLWGLLRQTYLR